MRIVILGSGAGGGLPQWNAWNDNSRAAFERRPNVRPRSQCSVAFSSDGENWGLINASPDLRSQIIANPQLHPRIAPRSSPISCVVLTGAEIDQITGLLALREHHAFTIYATPETLAALDANPIFRALPASRVIRTATDCDMQWSPLPGVNAKLIDLPGKVPLYLEDRYADPAAYRPGHCVAVVLESGGKRVVIAPGCAQVTPRLLAVSDSADILLFDGTLFTGDEMIAAAEGSKTAARMGHVPMTGPNGAIGCFAACTVKRKLFIHVNNTNPALDDHRPERRALRESGWELAEDGQELTP